MKVLRQVFDFYINSSIHVALAVVAFTVITYFQFEIKPDLQLIIFIGLATISGYNFVKYFGLAKFHHRSLATWLKIIQIFSIGCTMALPFFIIKMEVKTIIFLTCLAVVTFLYAIPLIPKKYFFDSNHNLRQISGLKIYVIAFVWTAVTVGLPIIDSNVSIHFDVVITMIQRFLIVIVLMLPFEIRDMVYDNLRLATIPQTIGVHHTKVIGAFLLLVFLILEFLKDNVSNQQLISIITITISTMILVIIAKKEQPKYYSSFLVESLPLFWLGLLVMFG